ncbi:Calx-beta domain-containing protein [Pedobacter soli]|uniref:Gliding motility-associated C-terminal domain-containing protein n=1 Tax=Pedobacter soli TaxID=390242 RepID=A0A1G7D9D1_9SPHI|nr:Calx-beta domain-containing protein [Pedobacter soli]SDE48109.1 gliding motility-associated C-terminal domain-containing protein [Pedobacter soli]
MKKLLLLSFLMLIMSSVFAADYYWVGGAGNWTDLSHWASTSGGVANRSIIPGTGDDVYFDANSGLANNTLVTLPTTGHAYCRNMSWNGVTTNAIFRNTGSFQLQINGNLELAATVRYAIMTINFTGSSNATFRTNGAVRVNTAGLYNSFIVNKPSGSLTLLDGIPNDLAVQNLTLTAGTLNLSGQTHGFVNLVAGGSTVRSMNITNASLTLGSTWDTRGSNMTLTATGSTVTADMFHSAGLTFDKVFAMRDNPDMDINNNTFSELTLASTVSQIGTQRIGSNNTIGKLEFKSGGRIAGGGNIIGQLILAPGKGYIFHGTNTINTLMQLNTEDCDALGELRGIDANAKLSFGAGATANIKNVFITSLTALGNIAPIPVVGVDGGSNVGFNITPRTSGNATLYWVGGAGDWNDKSHWSATSGGSGGACVPFTSDNVIFDANSGFTSGNNTVSVTSTVRCHDMTWTNVTGSPVFDIGGYTTEIWGSVELDPTLTLSAANTQYVRGNIQLKGTEASTFLTKGASLGNPLFNIDKTSGGGITLMDDINFPNLSLTHARGGLSMAGKTVNILLFNSTTGVGRTIDISNATITVNNWNLGLTNVTWVNNAAGSFITANRAFTANGLTYPKVYCNTVLDEVNIQNTTIGELTFTNTAPANGLRGLLGGNTVGTLEFKSGGLLRGNNTITNLLLAPSKPYAIWNTQTVTGLFRFNSPDCNGLGELRGAEGTSATINFGPAATRDLNNIYLQNMTATGSGVPVTVTGADAGGNSGFTITTSGAGARYWVGGSGDWSDSAHWSNTSGGAGGACVPTAANDVFFNASSFTNGSSAVTINSTQAYCRNMNWTGANFSPTFTKPATLDLEIWGDLVMNNNVRMDAALTFTGASNTSITSNGGGTGATQFIFLKPIGYTVTLLDNFSNPVAYFFPRSGGVDLSNRTVVLNGFDNSGSTVATNINITGANITGAWRYQGGIKTLTATNSVIKARRFLVDGGTYNIVDATGGTASDSYVNNTTVNDLLFSNPSATSAVFINGGNTIGRLEFKGKGNIAGTGNTIETLIFSPGKVYTFLSGSTNTISKDWFGSGTPCNLTEINSSAAGAFTVNKTAGNVEFDYVRLRNITATGITPFKALEHSEDLGGNTNWSISPYNNSTPILGLGPDKTLCAGDFPYTIKTDGFFASPIATYTWGDGSTNSSLAVAGPGTYTVTVSYPDGCSRTDNIVITRSDVVINPITGTPDVCVGAVTNLTTTTTGGVWSSSNTAVATVSTTGAVTGVTAGTADIIYTVTNSNGCVGALTQTVTVNAMPTVNATTGPNTLFAGDNITLSNTIPLGVWSSSNTAVATVSAAGVVTGVAAGTANILYTVTGTGGCSVSSTTAITVDAFDPAKRVLSITKTTDAAEPATNGAFAISLPTGINAIEPVTVNYTVSGTATSGSDYIALTGTATIATGQNSVSVPVNVTDDSIIEGAESVIVTLTSGTSAKYTYTVNGAAGNATVTIADDDNTVANHLLGVTAQLNANEPTNTGTFTIALPAGISAAENITVAYTMSGTSTNGVDYETLSGTATLLAGQNSVVINVKALDDQIIEQTETIILNLTGGTSASAVNYPADAAKNTATLLQADNDNTAAIKQLAVTSNGNAAEPATNSSFTISLPTGYVSALPITITYAFTGAATYGADYSSTSATTVTLPAGQNSIQVPVNVINDNLIETAEPVILTLTNGVAKQGATTVFTLTPDPAATSASLSIADDDNTPANKTLTVTAQNGAEPSTNGAFTISLPAGVLASENVTVNYSVSGTATAGTDYAALPGTAVIPAGANSVTVPLIVIDNKVIENTETVILTLTGGTSANFTYTPGTTNSATADIADDDAASNTTVVLLTKVSDAVEGGTKGQYRVSLPPGITSAEDITITLSTGGTATRPADYSLTGLTGANLVIPAGTNEVFVGVDAINDSQVEGPETVTLTLNNATSASTTYSIDPAGNGAAVTIIDVNAASTTALEVIAGTNAAEPATNGAFSIKLAGAATSAWPVTVGYTVSGTAVSGLDYQSFGTITIPAGQNSVAVDVHVLDDQIFEPTETINFKVLSGSAKDGSGNAYIFPADPAKETITVNIADNDVLPANQVLQVVKTTDAAEPNVPGSFTVSLPAGYSSSADLTLNYTMSGTAIRNTDYSVSTVTLPAYANSVSIPVLVIDDQIVEATETATLTLNSGADGNGFNYTVGTAAAATVNIADDDNTAANRMLSAVATANATEGGAAGSFTLKLPAGITASAPVTVNYTVGGTATNGADYTALSGTATIAAGQNSVAVAVTAINDNIIELPENVILTITGGTDVTNTFTVDAGSETASVDVFDNDDVAANKALKITRTAHAAEPATNGGFSIAFEAGTGITSSEDVTVNYTIAGTATNGTDYETLSGTVVLPAGSNSVPVNVIVKDDQLIEPITETVTLTITGGTSNNFAFTPSASAALRTTSLNITDNENISANRVITYTKTADAAEPGINGNVRISLPPNIFCQVPINLTVFRSGTATGGTDYANLPALVIPAGQNYIDVPVQVIDDNLIEQDETVVITHTGLSTAGLSAGSTFTTAGSPITVNIADDDNITTNRVVTVSLGRDATEGGVGNNGSIRFNFAFPTNISPSESVAVNYTVTGTAIKGTDYTPLSNQFNGTVNMTTNASAIVATVVDDDIIEGNEDVTVTINSVTSPNFTYTFSGPAKATIFDNDTTPANLELSVAKTADATEGGANGEFAISLPGTTATATEAITVNYILSGTATNGTDYTALTGSAVIPAGSHDVKVPVTATADQLIEGLETVTMTLTGGSSTSFTFTPNASNINATVNITDADNMPANLVLNITKLNDAAEPGASGRVNIALPAGISSKENITVNYSVSGTATPGTDYATLSGTATILAGQNSVTVPISVIDDQLIEQTETVVLALAGGSSTNFTYTATGNVSVNLADDDNIPANLVLNVTKTQDASEPASNGNFNIALPAGLTVPTDITVNYTVTGTATAGLDYASLSGTLTIPAGTNSVDLPLTVTDDQQAEGTENVTLTVTSGTATGLAFTSGTAATIDLADDDNIPDNLAISIQKTTDAAEPGTNGNFNITLPAGVTLTEDITVTYTVAGTATAGTDYTALTGSAVILAGQNSVSVPVLVINDNIIERTETVTATLTGATATSFSLTAAGNATVNIADDDSGNAANKTLSIVRTAHATEPSTNGGFRIQLPTGFTSVEDVVVNYTVTGSAIAGTDYQTLSGTVTIPAGQNSVPLVVQVIDDKVIELAKTVVVTLDGGSSTNFTFPITTVSAQRSTSLNLNDDDNVAGNKVLTFAKITDAAEPATNGLYRISLPTGITASVGITISYFINPTTSTAKAGVDYANLGTIVLAAGQNYVDIPINVIDDKIIEGTETIQMQLNGTASSFSFSFNQAPYTVLNIGDDEDTSLTRTVSITKSADASEPGTAGGFNFSLPTGVTSTEDITVHYSVSGTATAGTDYTALSGTLIIPAGQNSVTVPVSVIDDQLIEGIETVVATLTGASSTNFSFTATGNASLNIADDDNTAANRTLVISKTTDAAEPATNGAFSISLPAGVTATENITVAYTVSGTATAGTDYTALSGSAVIFAGQTSVNVPVLVKNDNIIEGTETVVATLNGATSANFSFTATGNASLNIADDDNTPANLAISISKAADAAEPATNGAFSISLPAGVTAREDITVAYSVSGTAITGTDYTALSGSAVIMAGQTSVNVPVLVKNDNIIEGTETVVATLTDATSANFSFTASGNASLNIADDDNTPANLAISISKAADAAEPATNGAFSISLPTGVTATEDITVAYTVSGTATAGTDYTALSGSAVILAGQTSVSVPVLVKNDNIIEGTETVLATLTGATSANFSFTASGNASLNIADDDNTPANLAVSISKTTDAAEPATNGTFSMSLPTGVTAAEDITVVYSVSGTATAGTDYTALSGSAVILAGQTSVSVPVLVKNDNIIEGTETVVATLTGATSANFSFTATGNASLNIADDDNTAANLAISISKTADAAEPASNGTFSISLPTGVTATEDITVAYTVSGTATAGTDYTALSGSAVILAGQTSVNVPVLVKNDNIIEGTETVVATLTGATSANFSFTVGGNASLKIADDDNTPANLAISISKTADAAEPASNGAFSISLPTGVTATENITVAYTVSGSATAGTDYTALSGSAVILAGQTSVNVPVVVKDDNLYEDPETVVLTLTGGTSSNFAFTATGNATVTIADDDKKDQVITFTALPVKILGDGTFTLNATGGASGNPVTYTSSNPAVATVTGNTVTIVGVGTANIIASQAGNATYNAAANVTQVLTVIAPLNTAPTLAAIANQQVCVSSTTQSIALSGITAGAEQNQSTTLSVSTDNAALFAAISVTQGTAGNAVLNYRLNPAGGTATITVTVKDNGGTLNGGTDTFSRTFTLTAAPLPQVQVVATPGTSVSKGETIELKASGALSYSWATASGTISGQNSATLTVRPSQNTTYTVTGTNASGCTSTATITITVMEDYNLLANNVLTPNGDGKNDFFVIKNIDMYPNNQVRIFDRAGREVYAKKNYNNEWDGTINGTPLDENTYYYIIELGNGVKAKRGFITIVRKF